MNSSPIKTVRIRKGISQVDLAKASGFSQAYLSFLETGNRVPTYEKLKILADALGCTTDDLISGKCTVQLRAEVTKEMEPL